MLDTLQRLLQCLLQREEAAGAPRERFRLALVLLARPPTRLQRFSPLPRRVASVASVAAPAAPVAVFFLELFRLPSLTRQQRLPPLLRRAAAAAAAEEGSPTRSEEAGGVPGGRFLLLDTLQRLLQLLQCLLQCLLQKEEAGGVPGRRFLLLDTLQRHRAGSLAFFLPLARRLCRWFVRGGGS